MKRKRETWERQVPRETVFCCNTGRYCWWKKSCTSWYVVNPIIYKVYVSQVVQDFFRIASISCRDGFERWKLLLYMWRCASDLLIYDGLCSHILHSRFATEVGICRACGVCATLYWMKQIECWTWALCRKSVYLGMMVISGVNLGLRWNLYTLGKLTWNPKNWALEDDFPFFN